MSDDIPVPGAAGSDSELDRRIASEVAVKGLGPAVRDNLDELVARFRDPHDDERADGRRMAAWARHDPKAGPALASLSGSDAKRLRRAEVGEEIDGSGPSLPLAGAAAGLVEAGPDIAPELVEANGARIKTYHQRNFKNWERPSRIGQSSPVCPGRKRASATS